MRFIQIQVRIIGYIVSIVFYLWTFQIAHARSLVRLHSGYFIIKRGFVI